MFEVEAYDSSWSNVAKGKSATQSSILRHFRAERAIDGKWRTFTHTNDDDAWLQIDLEDTYNIEYLAIKNRYCGKNSYDKEGCLCRLSNASVSLLDADGNVVVSETLGDTCGMHKIYVKFCPSWL